MRSDKAAYTAASLAASYKLDEGYSDDTRSQLEGEDSVAQNVSMLLPDWILAYSESERAGACLSSCWLRTMINRDSQSLPTPYSPAYRQP